MFLTLFLVKCLGFSPCGIYIPFVSLTTGDVNFSNNLKKSDFSSFSPSNKFFVYPLRVSFYWKEILKGHFSASNDYLREKTGAIFKTTFFLAGKSYFYRDLRLLDRLQIECGLCNLS